MNGHNGTGEKVQDAARDVAQELSEFAREVRQRANSVRKEAVKQLNHAAESIRREAHDNTEDKKAHEAADEVAKGLEKAAHYLNTNSVEQMGTEATKVVLPTFEGGGTHVNVSGVMLAKHAPNKANAMKLIEWLAEDNAQHIYADVNYEYPVRAGVAVNPTIAGYGKLNPDPMPIARIAEHRKAASALVDKVGFDN